MSFASKYGKASPIFNVKITKPVYTNLADLFSEYGSGQVFAISGVYINTKGKYGPQACIAINESTMVNLPSHLLEVCQEMRQDPDAVEAINNGQAGFRVYQYTSKAGNSGFSVDWVDLK